MNPCLHNLLENLSAMTGVPEDDLSKLVGPAQNAIVSADFGLQSPEQFELVGSGGLPLSLAGLKNLRLVKYYPDKPSPSSAANHSIQALADGTVHVSRPCNFNDPFDSLPCIDEGGILNELAMRFAGRFGLVASGKGVVAFDQIADHMNHLASEDLPRLAHVESDPIELELDLAYQSMLLAAKTAGRFTPECVTASLKGMLDKRIASLGNCRIACFSDDPVDLYMWAHYAADHSGFCVEYALPTEPREVWDRLREHEQWLLSNIFCVFYRMKRPDHTPLVLDLLMNGASSDNIGSVYAKILCSKGFSWSFERERRLIVQDATAPDNIPFFPVKNVYFGIRMPADRRREVAKTLEGQCVEFSEMTLADGYFGLVEKRVEGLWVAFPVTYGNCRYARFDKGYPSLYNMDKLGYPMEGTP